MWDIKTLVWGVRGAVGLALVVVVLGAFTRLVDAGLGCPDWPGCYGFLVVPGGAEEHAAAAARYPDNPLEAGKAWAEMVHRYFAGTLGLVILAIAVACSVLRSRGAAVPVKLPWLLVVLVGFQAAFGAWTVTLKLWPQVVTTHLLGGFATLTLLWLLALRLGTGRRWSAAGVVGLSGLAIVVVVVQIALGGWMSANYAALACPDFPTCHGQWWPNADFASGFDLGQDVGPNYLGGQMESASRVAIHWSHRLGAVVVLVVVGLLWRRLAAAGSELATAVAGVLAVQLALGVMNVMLELPLWVATLHNGVGAVLLLTLVSVHYRALQGR